MQYEVDGKPIAYERIPVGYMTEAVRGWVERGRVGKGSFLGYVVANQLFEAVVKADDTNGDALKRWVMWFRDHAPPQSFGGEVLARTWAAHRGLSGHAAALAIAACIQRALKTSAKEFPAVEAPGLFLGETWTWRVMPDRVLFEDHENRIKVIDWVWAGELVPARDPLHTSR